MHTAADLRCCPVPLIIEPRIPLLLGHSRGIARIEGKNDTSVHIEVPPAVAANHDPVHDVVMGTNFQGSGERGRRKQFERGIHFRLHALLLLIKHQDFKHQGFGVNHIARDQIERVVRGSAPRITGGTNLYSCGSPSNRIINS